jgi:ATP-binding cassette subfamily B protein
MYSILGITIAALLSHFARFMKLPTSTFRFIYYFARQQWVKFSFIIFSFMVWATSEAMLPYFLKQVVNSIASFQGNRADIFPEISVAIMLIAAFVLADEFFMRAEGIVQIFTFPKFRAQIRSAVFNYVTSHSHEYFASNFAGNIAQKLASLPTSCQSLVEIICFQFVTALTGGVIVFVMMWATQPVFAAILLGWLFVHLSITLFFLRRGDHLWEVHSEAVSVLSGKIVDVFSNMLNVRLFARRHYEAAYLGEFQDDEIIKAKKAMWMIEIMRFGLGINGICLILGMLFTLLYGWIHHWVTLGDFTQVMMQAVWLLGWMWYITFQLTIFVREKGTVGNALMLIQQSHDLQDKRNAQNLQVTQGEICFDDVTFAYQTNRAVFNQLNLTIPGGQKIGLVGYSGSGKSTFVNLILRFYDVQSGQIVIDQQNIADVTQDSLRAQIAMIPQEPSLFHRTLMENIRYGRLDATDDEVIEASKQAHCHEFIEKLDEGYNALVGERGIKLSGGQRQRIAIARAMLKNAPILILDEATSSLDSVTEKLIQESLHILMQGRTTIVVAHRLSTLSDLDRIIVFDKGHIIEEGTKEQLLSINGRFAKLWNMQTEGFLADRSQMTEDGT